MRVPLSVVVPTVDRPTLLARCVDAILAGEATPREVVVVDQGGLPETAQAVAERNTQAVPVRHVRVGRRGLSAARNVGIAHAASSWIAFTDDDCVPDGAWLAAAHRRLVAADAPDGVAGRVLPGGAADHATHTLSLRVSTTPAVFRGRAYPWRVGTGGNMVLRADLVRAVGGYDERLGAGTAGAAGEDLEIVHRLLRRGATLAYEPDVIVYHDRVDDRRRLDTRHSYGYGMGVFTGLWLGSDRWVAVVFARWLVDRVRIAGRAVLKHDRWRLREERLLLSGAFAGVRYGRRLGVPYGSAPRAADDPLPFGD